MSILCLKVLILGDVLVATFDALNGRNDCPILTHSRGKLYNKNGSNGSKMMVLGKGLLFLQAVASFGYNSC